MVSSNGIKHIFTSVSLHALAILCSCTICHGRPIFREAKGLQLMHQTSPMEDVQLSQSVEILRVF
ncbi:hypothetical protein ACP275_02G063700 [Erythranthe tilingii]